MNQLETAYSQHLQQQVLGGTIQGWFFEAVKLNLANGQSCSYTPDFMVIRADGVIEFHEVKGYWEEDARVKIKVAADKFPFVFVAVQKKHKQWQFESFTDETNT